MTARILVLGGIDPCGGAGITADAIVAAQHRAQALPVLLVLTEQNHLGFRRLQAVDEAAWVDALDCALTDGEVHAVKIGLLANAQQIELLSRCLQPLRGRVPIVVDPVLSATAGGMHADADHAAAYREHLVPLATLLTPNLSEFEAICAGDAALALSRGATAVLLKGGHGEGAFADDILWQHEAQHRWRRERLSVGRVHGTGCALATAIAAGLAHGLPIEQACERAGDWLHSLLRMLAAAAQVPDGPPRNLPLFGEPQPDR